MNQGVYTLNTRDDATWKTFSDGNGDCENTALPDTSYSPHRGPEEC